MNIFSPRGALTQGEQTSESRSPDPPAPVTLEPIATDLAEPGRSWGAILLSRLGGILVAKTTTFVLAGVALDPTRMQEDGMHPNAEGEPPVLDTVWPYLKPLLKKNAEPGGR